MRLVGVAVTAVVGLGVLAGCSTGGTANETLPPSASSPAETSTALPPLGPPDLPMPDEAREQTAAGVQAFARYYLSLINRLEQTLDPTPLRTLSSTCETCERIADDAETDKAAGYNYAGGTLTITSMGDAAVNSEAAEVAFVLDQAPFEVHDANGVKIDELSSPLLAGLPGGMSAEWAGDHWIVSSLSFG
jgi:hypothetical protein